MIVGRGHLMNSLEDQPLRDHEVVSRFGKGGFSLHENALITQFGSSVNLQTAVSHIWKQGRTFQKVFSVCCFFLAMIQP